ncbi:hypothetical protein OAO87_00590 [bacterium]|nr:hypothetical protein [bacterium]
MSAGVRSCAGVATGCSAIVRPMQLRAAAQRPLALAMAFAMANAQSPPPPAPMSSPLMIMFPPELPTCRPLFTGETHATLPPPLPPPTLMYNNLGGQGGSGSPPPPPGTEWPHAIRIRQVAWHPEDPYDSSQWLDMLIFNTSSYVPFANQHNRLRQGWLSLNLKGPDLASSLTRSFVRLGFRLIDGATPEMSTSAPAVTVTGLAGILAVWGLDTDGSSSNPLSGRECISAPRTPTAAQALAITPDTSLTVGSHPSLTGWVSVCGTQPGTGEATELPPPFMFSSAAPERNAGAGLDHKAVAIVLQDISTVELEFSIDYSAREGRTLLFRAAFDLPWCAKPPVPPISPPSRREPSSSPGPSLPPRSRADAGDDPRVEDMIAARASALAQAREARVLPPRNRSEVLSELNIFTLSGALVPLSDVDAYLPTAENQVILDVVNALTSEHGGMEQTRELEKNTRYSSIPLATRSSNNLGGMGPNNGTYCYDLAFNVLGWYTDKTPCAGTGTGNYGHHPNFIRLNDVANLEGGQRIGMRIDNTSEYTVAKPAMNDFNGFLFQINLEPIYNVAAGQPGSFQPFESDLSLATDFIETVLGISLRAENSNAVSLFFSFFDQNTGEPVELKEVRRRSTAEPSTVSH